MAVGCLGMPFDIPSLLQGWLFRLDTNQLVWLPRQSLRSGYLQLQGHFTRSAFEGIPFPRQGWGRSLSGLLESLAEVALLRHPLTTCINLLYRYQIFQSTEATSYSIFRTSAQTDASFP